MEHRKPLSLSGDGYSIDEANCYDIVAIHTKLLNAFLLIEKSLKLSLDIDKIITIDANSILINGLDISYFNDYIWGTSRSKEYDRIMQLHCYECGFIVRDESSSILDISFDCYFNILKVEFKLASIIRKTKIELIFGPTLECISIYFNPDYNADYCEHSWLKLSNTLCSLEDELLFFELRTVTDESVKSLLPECYIPSAYDFTSADFIDRLKVFEMLKY